MKFSWLKLFENVIYLDEEQLSCDISTSGLSAPVPRGRKGKKVKKDVLKKAQFDEDLTKLDIDVDTILIDEGYKKHLKRQSNKYVGHKICIFIELFRLLYLSLRQLNFV